VTIYGNWALTWADADHPGVDRQHLLQMPLQRIRPGVQVNKHTATSLDFSVQNSIVFGSAYEVAAHIKADRNAASLADLLEAGIKGTALTLRDLSQSDRNVSVYLVDPDDLWLAAYDSTGTPWEFETEIKFRKTDGTAFPDWLLYQAYGTEGLLFKYTAGMDLSAATFTRAAAANYINVAGVTTAAATNVARDAHHQTISTTWTRTLRLESSTSEVLYFPWNHGVQSQTVYVKFVERGSLAGSDTLFHIGSATAATDARFLVDSTGTYYQVTHDNGSATPVATLAVAPSAGNVVEIRAVLNTDGSVLIGQSIGSAAETTATDATTATHAAWADTMLYINSAGTSTIGTNDFISISVAAGVQSMAHMRAL